MLRSLLLWETFEDFEQRSDKGFVFKKAYSGGTENNNTKARRGLVWCLPQYSRVAVLNQRFHTPGNFQQYSVIFGCYTRNNQSDVTTIKQIEARDVAVNNLDRTTEAPTKNDPAPNFQSAKARLRSPDLVGSEMTP